MAGAGDDMVEAARRSVHEADLSSIGSVLSGMDAGTGERILADAWALGMDFAALGSLLRETAALPWAPERDAWAGTTAYRHALEAARGHGSPLPEAPEEDGPVFPEPGWDEARAAASGRIFDAVTAAAYAMPLEDCARAARIMGCGAFGASSLGAAMRGRIGAEWGRRHDGFAGCILHEAALTRLGLLDAALACHGDEDAPEDRT